MKNVYESEVKKFFLCLAIPVIVILLVFAIFTMIFSATSSHSGFTLGTYAAQDYDLSEAEKYYTELAYNLNQKIRKVGSSSDWKNGLAAFGANTGDLSDTPDEWVWGRSSVYDFDARYDEGLAKHTDKVLYDLLDSHAPIISKELKKLGDYRKGGNKGFDTAIIRLQEQCYVITSNFAYMTDKNGQPYGWGVAEYSTPEKFMGAAFTDKVYQREPEESYQLILDHLKKILPQASMEQIKKILK